MRLLLAGSTAAPPEGLVMNEALYMALRDCESEPQRELVKRAYELHQDDCDEGGPLPWTWARAAEMVFGWETISDEPARAELEAHGICPDCKIEAEHCPCCKRLPECECTCNAPGGYCQCSLLDLCEGCRLRAERAA